MTDYPLHGEAVLAPAHAVVAHPEQLSFEEAASVWMQFTGALRWRRSILAAGDGDSQTKADHGHATGSTDKSQPTG